MKTITNEEENFLLNIVAPVKELSNKKARKFIRAGNVKINKITVIDPLAWIEKNSIIEF